MSSLEIQVELIDGVERGVVVHLIGALDQPTRDGFLSRMSEILAQGSVCGVLDMERLSYVNSVAIGDIAVQYGLFREAGGDLVLLNPQGKVYHIIETVGLNSLLLVVKTMDEARTHFLRLENVPCPNASGNAPGR